MIDALEKRMLLSAFLDGTTLVVEGTSNNDAITIDETVDGTTAHTLIQSTDPNGIPLAPDEDMFLKGTFVAIRVVGGDGDDQILVFPTFGVNVLIYGDQSSNPPGVVGPIGATDGNDVIQGGAGGTPIAGLLFIGTTVYGGGGNDNVDLSVTTGFASVLGQDGDDRIFGGIDDDTILGGAGNDVLNGSTGNDIIHGDAGNDTLSGDEGDDTIQGGTNVDSMDGGAGFDWLDYSERTAANTRIKVTFDLTANDGTAGNAATALPTENDIMNDDSFEGLIGTGGNDILDASGSGLTHSVWIIGGGGNDMITGSSFMDNGDTIDGATGNDSIQGMAGNDSLLGGLGNDTVFGGDGDDVMFGDFNALENTTIIGTFGNDVMNGQAGNDIMDGEGGNDSLAGGADDDFFVTGLDGLSSGSDRYDGGGGNDTVDYSQRTVGMRVNVAGGADDGDPDPLLNGGLGEADDVQSTVERVLGTEFADTMSGQTGATLPHWFVGNGGNDSLVTGIANDTLDGGEGNDYLDGGTGSDLIMGGLGNDTTTYATRTGDVTLTLDGVANDGVPGEVDNIQDVETITSGSGSDSINMGGAGSSVRVFGGDGDDTLIGGDFNDYLDAGSGVNSLFGGDGADTMTGGNEADDFDGGAGFDQVDFTNHTGTVAVSFDNVANDGEPGEFDNVRSSVEAVLGGSGDDFVSIAGSSEGHKLIGGAGNDTLVGSSFNDTLDGGDGDDVLMGGVGNDYLVGGNGDDSLLGQEGNDRLLGGAGRDTLSGGVGNDTLIGAGGTDILIGGTGSDWVSYYYESRAVTVSLDNQPNDGPRGENDDVRNDVENMEGGRAADTLSGNEFANIIRGGPGNDSLIGYNGRDTLMGEAGSDTINGGAHNDVLIGGTGPDRLIGGTGTDKADYSSYTAAVFLSLDNLANDGAFNEHDKIDNDVESLQGGSGSDSIVGSVRNETLSGGAGNDTLRGGGGNDSIIGGAGFDQLVAGTGDDTIVANEGQRDTLTAGGGSDSLLYDIGLDILS